MNEHKKKNFLELPRYGGGNEEFKKFIAANLRYPKAALEARIEGKVLVEYEIDDNGIVHNPRVLRSLGYGCDEEAMRVVSLLRFKKVKNRGVRVRVNTKTNINFSLPKTSISYTVTSKPENKKPDEADIQKKNKPTTYEYTISF
ncbi:MAG: energy transducer TonB [Bacteroidales bacterium]|nr:energy transducer TonB [Bacteroidales bacterium]